MACSIGYIQGKPPWWIVHCQLWCPDIITGWWLSPTPLKNMSSSVGIMKFPIWWETKIKAMFQTTNQISQHQIPINPHKSPISSPKNVAPSPVRDVLFLRFLQRQHHALRGARGTGRGAGRGGAGRGADALGKFMGKSENHGISQNSWKIMENSWKIMGKSWVYSWEHLTVKR